MINRMSSLRYLPRQCTVVSVWYFVHDLYTSSRVAVGQYIARLIRVNSNAHPSSRCTQLGGAARAAHTAMVLTQVNPSPDSLWL